MLVLVLMPLVMLLLMFLPLIALPLFWLFPLAQAIPLYILSMLVAGAMVWFMHGSMTQPAVTGREAMIGKAAKVVSLQRSGNERMYLVEVKGELWTATGDDTVQVGETVTIIAMDGIRLIIGRKDQARARAQSRRQIGPR
jgi:membrane protein implicated in regulation of membrane protease activity